MRMRLAQLMLLVIFFGSSACGSREASEWNTSFQAALRGATRLRVRPSVKLDSQIENEGILLDISDKDAITEFVQHTEIKKCDLPCECSGDVTMEFYREDQLVGSLSFHHGRNLRWSEGKWPGDGVLTRESRNFLLSWLDEHGVEGPKQEYEEDQRQAKEWEEAQERWLSAMPSSLKRYWGKVPDAFGEVDTQEIAKMNNALARQFPKHEDRILALLDWYGAGMGSWPGHPAYEMVPEKLLLSSETKDILSAIDGNQLTEQQLEGTARFFSVGRSLGKYPDDSKLFPPELKQRLLEHSLKSPHEDNRDWAHNAFGEQTDQPHF